MQNAAQELEQATNNLAVKTAETLGCAAGYLRSRDMTAMLSDFQQTARENPLPTLVGAAAFGFLVGAFLRRL
ncbi:MAG TPA: hypothetical protein VKU01_21655 [Bryobacteraceae bacterium]|nr:hypothetical protein [Bryobacteraceae bacterium]